MHMYMWLPSLCALGGRETEDDDVYKLTRLLCELCVFLLTTANKSENHKRNILAKCLDPLPASYALQCCCE